MRVGLTGGGLCPLLLLVTALSATAQTQITTGVIQGTVVDESGAVVTGANVEAKNLDTNFARSLMTGGDGPKTLKPIPVPDDLRERIARLENWG